jgi:hypothetical protein
LPAPANTSKPFPSNLSPRGLRLFALLCCVVALYFSSRATSIAATAASGLISLASLFGNFLGTAIVDLGSILSTAILIFLLLLGYGLMGRWFNGQRRPILCLGLYFRPGWVREWALGAAIGWGMVVAAVLPMALAGSLHFSIAITLGTVWLLAVNTVLLLLAALAQELIYRGYAFQRLIEAIGPIAATLLMAVYFGVQSWQNPTHSTAGTLVIFLAGILLALAYLRTRALWLVWGLHFAWTFSEGVLFGLPVGGFTRFATVLQTDTTGPAWLTGSDFGPEASVMMVLTLVAAIIVLLRVTRDYNWKYNAPVILPAGIPMDVAPPAEHVAMEKTAAAAAPLVQILPVAPPDAMPVAPLEDHEN